MAYPYIPARNHGGRDNLPITRIVIHGTVSPCVPGGARAIANYFATTTRDASTQYVVDPGEIVRAVPDDTIAYGAPPNAHTIHIELCDPQTGSGSRWSDAAHESMLHLAAGLVRALCDEYGIPIEKLTSADLLAGKRGICGHIDVSLAWHETTHDDPGPDFPWAHFLDLVRNGDDMPLTPADLAAVQVAAAKGVLLTKTTVLGNPDGEAVITGLGRLFRENQAALTEARATTASLQSQLANLKAQVASMSADTSRAVRDTLTSGVVQVDVNINDGSAP